MTLRTRVTQGYTAVVASLALAGLSPTHAFAAAPGNDYPTHPVKIIVPHTAGGLVDLFARSLAQYMTTSMGQTVFVENRPGGNQIIGSEAAAHSAPDGYTLLVATQTSMVFNPIIQRKLPYDPQRDFTPISMLFTTPFYLIVRPTLPVHTVPELIALAKKDPGKLTYASLGTGSSQQLAAEMFKARTGIDVLHVPYRGSPESSVAMMSGQVDMTFDGGGTSLPNIRSGKVRALASSGKQRSVALPDVPTLGESIPGLDITVWIGLMAPAGTPAPVVERLNRATAEMLRLPETQKKFVDLGVELAPSTPEELGARIRADLPEWTKVIRNAGIQAD